MKKKVLLWIPLLLFLLMTVVTALVYRYFGQPWAGICAFVTYGGYMLHSLLTRKKRQQEQDEELQQLYGDAYKIYNQISFGKFDYSEETTMEKDGFTYYKITDSRFKTYDDFQNYLLQYFTEQFVNNSILSPDNVMFAKGDDGGLYYLGGGRGVNPFYAGHTFAMDKEGEDELGFKATAYYTNEGSIY